MRSFKDGFLGRLANDYRTAESNDAFVAAMEGTEGFHATVSIGGGPTRANPNLINLNIELLPNVDVVATAYCLPFEDNTLFGLHCEAVLEHLEFPDKAVAEMYRVLCPGKKIYAVTPFLQGFHGFPSHFQNYTLIGHCRLFERAGFRVIASGVCVGPTVALTELCVQYLRELTPNSILRRGVARILWLVLRPSRALDRFLNLREGAQAMASSTYVLAQKSE